MGQPEKDTGLFGDDRIVGIDRTTTKERITKDKGLDSNKQQQEYYENDINSIGLVLLERRKYWRECLGCETEEF